MFMMWRFSQEKRECCWPSDSVPSMLPRCRHAHGASRASCGGGGHTYADQYASRCLWKSRKDAHQANFCNLPRCERTREQDASHTVLAHHKSTDETLLLSCSIEVVQPLDLMSFIYVKSS